MKISIGQPLSFSEIGRKDNQEDFLYPYPESVSADQRFFILCDGMGGHEHGEVASQTVAEAMGKYLEKTDLSKVTTDDFNAALAYAYDCLDEKDTDEDGGKKMGTTMTCVIFHDGGALVAHIGDSRVYHINPKTGIRHVTSDHSLVNLLRDNGELTEEEAKNYPHKNIITRAMQPHQERRAKAEISLITDIEPGDYFFMCCDGVLEQLTNDRLCEILASKEMTHQKKLLTIHEECAGKTKDNYTCWLIPISNVERDETDVAEVDEDVIQAVSEDTDDANIGNVSVSEDQEEVEEQDIPSQPNLISRLNKSVIIGIVLLIILLIGCCVVWMCHNGESDANDSQRIEDLSKFDLPSK